MRASRWCQLLATGYQLEPWWLLLRMIDLAHIAHIQWEWGWHVCKLSSLHTLSGSVDSELVVHWGQRLTLTDVSHLRHCLSNLSRNLGPKNRFELNRLWKPKLEILTEFFMSASTRRSLPFLSLILYFGSDKSIRYARLSRGTGQYVGKAERYLM